MSGCFCTGPQNGDPFCPCEMAKMHQALQQGLFKSSAIIESEEVDRLRAQVAALQKDNDGAHELAAHYREAIRCPESEDGQHEWDFEGQCNICEQWAREIIDAALEQP